MVQRMTAADELIEERKPLVKIHTIRAPFFVYYSEKYNIGI